MNKKIKTIFALGLFASLMFSQVAYAGSNNYGIEKNETSIKSELLYSNPLESEGSVTENVNVITENIHNPIKSPISVYGTTKPTSSVNISGGRMDYEGTANTVDLYSEDCFTGVTSVTFSITNYRSSKLTVQLYKRGDVLPKGTYKFSGNSTSGYGISGLSSSGEYYFRFICPCDFEGSVINF